MCQPGWKEDSFHLVQDLHSELNRAMTSLEGKEVSGKRTYVAWIATHITKVAEGYILLRATPHSYSARLLVRPIIEAALIVAATMHQPGFFFQKAYTEFEEAIRFLKESRTWAERFAADVKERARLTAALDQQIAARSRDFGEFEKHWRRESPQEPSERKRVSARNIADSAGFGSWYTIYLRYCQPTHGALDAVIPDQSEPQMPHDDMVVALMLVSVLDTLSSHLPVEVPALAQFRSRVYLLHSSLGIG